MLCGNQALIFVLTPLFELSGLLISYPSIGKHCADILRELINMEFLSSNELLADSTKSVEADVIISMCSSCENVLSTFSSVPNEHILSVISDLFLKLGTPFIFVQM